jgi:hypothetical protein
LVLLIICSPISSIHEESLWVGLPAQVPRNTQAFFEGAVQTTVCNGTSTKFWLNRWLQDKTIAEYAPNLIQIIPKSLEATNGGPSLTQQKMGDRHQGGFDSRVLNRILANLGHG